MFGIMLRCLNGLAALNNLGLRMVSGAIWEDYLREADTASLP